MAFEAKNFVLCSKFNLFKAHCNLWIYCTGDTLEQCMAENYFQPRRNLKNQDSPEVGDVIQLVVEHSKLAYLKIVAKTEQPYNITVARTFLENEADIIAELADKASKTTDFTTPITGENLGITQAEQSELEDKIDLAANSGRMITTQGFWYAKMHSETVAPSADNGTNYADFSQVDGEGNPIIVTYVRTGGVWVQDQTITPPADYDGYVAITSKIWDIAEQDGQQGGRILWNHVSKEFTPYPQIINLDSVELTGDSTVVMPATPDDDNIANVGFVLEHCAARNVGDIFYTSRKDSVLNGAVPCDGTQYQTTDFSGAQAPGVLLQAGKLPYVPLATYATLLSTNGSVGVFGWDGLGTTAFKVPTLTDIFIETGTSAQVGDYIAPSLPNVKGSVNAIQLNGQALYAFGDATGALSVQLSSETGYESIDSQDNTNKKKTTLGLDASVSSSVYNDNTTTVQPNSVRYRAMIQLSTGSSDQSLGTLAEVAYSGQYSDLLNKPTIPAAQVNSDWNAVSGVAQILNKPTLATVATTGNYNDLTNKPTIPAAQVNADWNATSGVAEILNKPSFGTAAFANTTDFATSAQGNLATTAVQPGDLATVATTGSYNDLSNKPTIPTVNNSTITITQGGVTKGSFTLNQASSGTIALDAGGGGGSSVPQSIDAEIVGTLTVASNGDVSGMSNTNKLVIPGLLDMSNASTFEMVFAFTTISYSGIGDFFNIYPYNDISAFDFASGVSGLRFKTWYNGASPDTLTGTTVLSANTKYYAKVTYDGTNYTIYLSTDGVNWSLEATAIATYVPKAGIYNLGHGMQTVHTAECYIKKNGILIWQGMDAPGLHQRVAKGHEVIEFQAPTADNNYTWYRKYADGWDEQGGISATGSDTSGTITLPITMQDNNYTAIAGNGNNAANNYFTISRPEATTTTIKWYKSSSSMNGYWEVKGMAAS